MTPLDYVTVCADVLCSRARRITFMARFSISRAHRLFLIQFASYFLATFNIRAVAGTSYMMTAVTDLAIAGLSFWAIKHVVEAKTRAEQVGYVVGGMCGAQIALLLSRLLGV